MLTPISPGRLRPGASNQPIFGSEPNFARPGPSTGRVPATRRAGPAAAPGRRRADPGPRPPTLLALPPVGPWLGPGRAGSDVQILDLESVLLDELAPGLDIVAHEGGKQVVGGGGVLQPDLQQGP